MFFPILFVMRNIFKKSLECFVNILICISFGSERDLLKKVHDCIERGGKVVRDFFLNPICLFLCAPLG